MKPNPYQPPAPTPHQDDGLLSRLLASMGRVLRKPAESPYGSLTAVFMLSGRPFMEYGVVFSAMKGVVDRYYAAMPLVIDDEAHRRRNVVEAARVLRELVLQVEGLGPALKDRSLVVSMIPSYEQIDEEICQVVLPPEVWQQPDGDDLLLEAPQFT